MTLEASPARRSSLRAPPPPPPNNTHAPTRSSSLRHSLMPTSSPPPAPSSPSRIPNPSPHRVGLAGTPLLPRAEPDLVCAFCAGSAEANQIGRKEDMVSCWECGSAGHPTCLDWRDMKIVKKVLGYCWMCSECKRCELCDTKGEDDDMLLCDSCDRGWHRSCLTPPLTYVPRGNWTCPTCHASANFFAPIDSVPLPPKRIILHPPAAPRPEELELERRRKEKGKQRALEEEEREEEEEDAEWEEDEGSVELEQRQTLKLTLRLGTLGMETPLKRPRGRPRKDGSVRPPDKDWAPKDWGHMAVREVEESSDEDPEEVEDKDPFMGILSAAEADVGDRKPDQDDKKRWDKARQGAELKALETLAATRASSAIPSPAASDSLDSPRSHRPDTPSAPIFPALPVLPPGGLASIPIANIKAIRFGEFEIETWYQAPFPEEFSRVADGRLWICEFCLKYMKGGFQAGRHRLKCKTRHPPGDEIYRDGKVSVFEVDGRKNKIYCQNLCLLAKMFLDHKTLYYDVEPFLFYVMTTADVTGAKFVGYFSKEKRSPTNNVSCIMTLPVRQRKGWGNLLIDFSYLLSKKEGRLGTPERPLSDLGLLSYRNYWTLVLFQYLRVAPNPDSITFEEISAKTAVTPEDIHYVLTERNMITDLSAPPPSSAPSPEPKASTSRGHNQWTARKRANKVATATLAGSSSRQPHHDDPHGSPAVVLPSTYRIHFDRAEVEALVEKNAKKGYLELKPEKLQWSPFLVTRGYGLGVHVGSTAKDPVTEVQSVGALGVAEAGPSGENGAREAGPSGEKNASNGVAVAEVGAGEVGEGAGGVVARSPELGVPMELANGEKDAQPNPPPAVLEAQDVPMDAFPLPPARVPSPNLDDSHPSPPLPPPPRRSHKRKPSPPGSEDEHDSPRPKRVRSSAVALRSLSQGTAESPRRLTRGSLAGTPSGDRAEKSGSSPDRTRGKGKAVEVQPGVGEVGTGIDEANLMDDIAAFLPSVEEATTNGVATNGVELKSNEVERQDTAKSGEVAKSGGAEEEEDVDAEGEEVDISLGEGFVAT